MLGMSVTSDINHALKQLDTLTPKQFPFTVALALTQTGKQIQAENQHNIVERFTLRRDWIVKGIKVKPATKQNLEVLIYSRDRFMGRQESGGDKRPMQAGGKYIAVPLSGARPSKTQIIANADLPQNLKNAFVITARDGRKYLAVRRGDKAAMTRRSRTTGGNLARNRGGVGGVVLMYELVKRVHIEARLGLAQDGLRIAKANFTKNLYAAAEAAMRSAR